MKKLLFSMAAMAIATFGFAQDKATYAPASKADLAKINKKIVPQQNNRGAAFFTEDFLNGLDGNNGIGAWTAEDSENASIWHINTPTSPDGEFSTGIQALQSSTAANGWMIFDADEFNAPVSDGVSAIQGFLTTPSIDMSAEASVLLEFQQYFRYCCQGPSPMLVQVSNDGGTSWSSFPSNDYFIESANAASDNMTTVIDISCAAANEADVQVRWVYNNDFNSSYSHYFWGVDDVVIYPNPNANDLGIDLVTNGDIWNFYEYRVLPMEQAIAAADGGLLVGTYFQNYGNQDQTNVTILVEVLDDAGTVLTSVESAPQDMLSFTNALDCPAKVDSVYMMTNWEPTEPGIYTIRATIDTPDAVDEVADNDVVLKTIEYTDATMGHDDPATFDTELEQSADGADLEEEGFGSHFQMNNDDSEVYGIVVYFGPATDVGASVEARLYDLGADGGFVSVDDSYVFIDYEVQQSDISTSAANPTATFIEFQNPEEVSVGSTYFGAIYHNGNGSAGISVLANGNLDSDFSTAVMDLNSDQATTWFNRPDVPAVRLAFDEIVGVEELTLIDGVSSITNSPNPVSNITNINYTLVNNLEVTIEIMDVTGKVIFSENQGTRAEGQHQLEINASSFADGVYFYSLISGDQRMTRKMVVSK